jgi:putative FmdB family regulatory protein
MPIYEYECEKCGGVTESLRSMSQADEPPACESCGHKKTRRLQSEFAAGGSKADEPSLPMGGCGRCGDPNGPCAMG